MQTANPRDATIVPVNDGFEIRELDGGGAVDGSSTAAAPRVPTCPPLSFFLSFLSFSHFHALLTFYISCPMSSLQSRHRLLKELKAAALGDEDEKRDQTVLQLGLRGALFVNLVRPRRVFPPLSGITATDDVLDVLDVPRMWLSQVTTFRSGWPCCEAPLTHRIAEAGFGYACQCRRATRWLRRQSRLRRPYFIPMSTFEPGRCAWTS